MDWDRIRNEWRQQPAEQGAIAIDALRHRDEALARQVRSRDRIETVAAVVVGLAFTAIGVVAVRVGAWLEVMFAAWLVAWAISVPVWLRRGRAPSRQADPGLPLLQHLQCRRDLALAQARMLERAWLWYVAPAMVGLAGMTLAASGPTPGALGYIGICVALGVAIAWWNRSVARTRFRRHADELQQQIETLAVDGEQVPTSRPSP
ncbi:hypothetical protein E4582_07050 [Luteimonas yindakuii]|uniref:Uncharacterized protein n=1 Tax=Luteimonas yindakuii TaxID=2565782 RepID=A0A4Z1R6J6_9GAMM|nr:hypothetical protein [Luteimonas yindakuii]TKS54536.1 hypothetical protein E4582_07050 [Luteimonas yindakuii]